MAVAVILVPVMMVDAFVMEMAEGASFIDRDVGIAFHDVDLIIFVPCHFRIIRVVMMLFRNFLAAATAASAMIMGVAFVAMVMPAFAAVIVGMALMAFVMAAFAAMVVVVVMTAFAAMIVGVAFVIVVMPAAATVVFFVFLVVGMFFGVMDGFLLLMAVAASAMMYMLFIVLFHGMSPYPE